MNETLQHSIDLVRRRVRMALVGETAARACVAGGAFLWLWLLADWMIEPVRTVRAVVLVVAVVALLVWLLRHSLSALLTRLPDSVIASWIERRRPELGDALLTVLSGRSDDPDAVRSTLLNSARRRATALLGSAPTPGVVDVSKLRPWFVMAGLAVVSLGAWAAVYPQMAGVFVSRLALSDQPWPRRVLLSSADFSRDDQGRLVRRVARDAPFELNVRAELTEGHTPPAEVRATLRLSDGGRSRSRLAAVGLPTDGDDAHQAYRMDLDRLRQDLVIHLRGGDARLGPLHVLVSPRPAVTSVELRVTPPDYLQARPYRQPASAVDEVPEGAELALYAKANKRLDRVVATLARAEVAQGLDATLGKDKKSFTVSLPPLAENGLVELSLLDEHGIDSQAPFRLPLRVRKDIPPRVEFSLVGIGRTVTPDAVLPSRVRVEDDHAIGQADLLMTLEQTYEFPLEVLNNRTAELIASPSLDLLTLRSDPAYRLARMEPGQQIKLQVVARDNYNLSEPHQTLSQTFTLTLVTADELVARLEEREKNLRQTFEQVYDEARGAQLNAQRLDDAPEDALPDDVARRRRLSMARLVERLSKVGDETNAVAEGFGLILDELNNNRVPNEDLKDRIGLRIVSPLKRIVAEQLPQLKTQTDAAQQALTDDPTQPALPDAAQQQLNTLVRDMELALNEMKAVETYNEVLALLRGIIEDQRDLGRKTDDARKSSLKNLLLD